MKALTFSELCLRKLGGKEREKGTRRPEKTASFHLGWKSEKRGEGGRVENHRWVRQCGIPGDGNCKRDMWGRNLSERVRVKRGKKVGRKEILVKKKTKVKGFPGNEQQTHGAGGKRAGVIFQHFGGEEMEKPFEVVRNGFDTPVLGTSGGEHWMASLWPRG